MDRAKCEEARQTGLGGVRHISIMLEDLICSGNGAMPSSARVPGCWQRPPSGWMKINTDAAFTMVNGGGATGAVLCNDQGVILAAAARAYSNVADALMAEALGARTGCS
jgi:hypothetical protein